MEFCRSIVIITAIFAVTIAQTGCGSAPSTGDRVTSPPTDQAQRDMAKEYQKAMVKPKGQRKAKP